MTLTLPFRKPTRPGPVGRVKQAFSNLQAVAVLALGIAVLALFVAVIK